MEKKEKINDKFEPSPYSAGNPSAFQHNTSLSVYFKSTNHYFCFYVIRLAKCEHNLKGLAISVLSISFIPDILLFLIFTFACRFTELL